MTAPRRYFCLTIQVNLGAAGAFRPARGLPYASHQRPVTRNVGRPHSSGSSAKPGLVSEGVPPVHTVPYSGPSGAFGASSPTRSAQLGHRVVQLPAVVQVGDLRHEHGHALGQRVELSWVASSLRGLSVSAAGASRNVTIGGRVDDQLPGVDVPVTRWTAPRPAPTAGRPRRTSPGDDRRGAGGEPVEERQLPRHIRSHVRDFGPAPAAFRLVLMCLVDTPASPGRPNVSRLRLGRPKTSGRPAGHAVASPR